MAAKFNLKIYQKATFRRSFAWKDVRRRAVNLTGYTAKLQIRDKPDGLVLLELTTENGGITITPLTGVIALYISDEATTALTWTKGVYDLLLTDSIGQAKRLIEGSITVSPAVTK